MPKKIDSLDRMDEVLEWQKLKYSKGEIKNINRSMEGYKIGL